MMSLLVYLEFWGHVLFSVFCCVKIVWSLIHVQDSDFEVRKVIHSVCKVEYQRRLYLT